MNDTELLAFVQFSSLLFPGFTTKYEIQMEARKAWKKYKRQRGLTYKVKPAIIHT